MTILVPLEIKVREINSRTFLISKIIDNTNFQIGLFMSKDGGSTFIERTSMTIVKTDNNNKLYPMSLDFVTSLDSNENYGIYVVQQLNMGTGNMTIIDNEYNMSNLIVQEL